MAFLFHVLKSYLCRGEKIGYTTVFAYIEKIYVLVEEKQHLLMN